MRCAVRTAASTSNSELSNNTIVRVASAGTSSSDDRIGRRCCAATASRLVPAAVQRLGDARPAGADHHVDAIAEPRRERLLEDLGGLAAIVDVRVGRRPASRRSANRSR